MRLNKIQKIEYENKIRETISSMGGAVDEGWIYQNSSVPVPITCKYGHRWKSLCSHVNGGHWCPECSGFRVNENTVRSLIEGKGGILGIDWSYINKSHKFEITCQEGHKWKVNWNSLKNKDCWCPYCAGHVVNEDEIRDYIENKGGRLDFGWGYSKSWDKFFVTCEKGHRWETCWNVIQSNHWCPHCKVFRKEQLFRETLERHTGYSFPTQRPEWLRYPSTKRPLELDGYNVREKIAFEYQGEHHYMVRFFSKKLSLDEVRRRDEFKKVQCGIQGVTLLIIPYWIPKESWVSEIDNILNQR